MYAVRKRVPGSFWIWMLAAFCLAVSTSGLRAAECEAVDQNDLPRDCTAMEEFGYCLFNAWDSYVTCIDATTGFFWGPIGCGFSLDIDLAECYIGLPGGMVASFFT